jgi:Arc/MetJ-type ribon-helix-helix transcriptional regulator
MAKVTISLPDDLLARLDEVAAQDAASRSGVVREAASEYITRRSAGIQAEAWRARVQTAIDGFQGLGGGPQTTSPSGLELLREIRSLPHDGDEGSGSPEPRSR